MQILSVLNAADEPVECTLPASLLLRAVLVTRGVSKGKLSNLPTLGLLFAL